MVRKIIHVDMDAFYASVEERDDPSLKGKPVAVGGLPEYRGVISTANYEARKYGVRSAIASKFAYKLCPQLILLKPDFKKYSDISKYLISIYEDYTDIIEPLSLDECYLDVTVNKKNIPTASEIAEIIKKRIKNELSLTASFGVAPNKLLAKIASDYNKPDGIFIIKPNQIDNFIKNLPVEKIWGVGKVTAKKMHSLNIKTCADLQKYTIPELFGLFGKFGETLFEFARGIDNRDVISENEQKSIGSEVTFKEDSADMDYIIKKLEAEIDTVFKRIRQKNLTFKTITLKAKYYDFNSITRRRTLKNYSDNRLLVSKVSRELLKKSDIGRKKIRLIGISLANFDNETGEQRLLEFYR